MGVRPIHTVKGFLDVLHQHVKLTACKRAIEQDRVEILGHFWDGGMGYWVAKITSEHGRMWWYKVSTDKTQFRYRVNPISEIQWEFWHGDADSNHPVHDGDRPEIYYSYRLEGAVECLDTTLNKSYFQSPRQDTI